jgi:hypothetical protein
MQERESILDLLDLVVVWAIAADQKLIRSKGKFLLLGNLKSAHARLKHKRIKNVGMNNQVKIEESQNSQSNGYSYQKQGTLRRRNAD